MPHIRAVAERFAAQGYLALAPDLYHGKSTGEAEQEPFFSVPDAKAFAEKQRQRGHLAEVIVHPGAGHAFFNDSRPEAYRRDAANDAWRRTLEHFGRHLRAG